MDRTKKPGMFDFAPEPVSNLQKGIDNQREIYKQASLSNEYELMVRCIENIKSEIRDKVVGIGNEKEMKKVEKVIRWYRTLHLRYYKKTENGMVLEFPVNINVKIRRALNIAYEILIRQLNSLQLI